MGIEEKASANLTQADFRGLRELANAAGEGFARGIVLYTGEQLMPYDANLWAAPLGVLWAGGGGRGALTDQVVRAALRHSVPKYAQCA